MTAREEGFELRFERLLDAPRAKVWRCWSEPALLEQWFHPPSWTTEVTASEQRPGGASRIVMRGPNGEESVGLGVILEAIPERRLVFTNAYTAGWIPTVLPAGTPLRTMIIELSDAGSRTRYVVRALHWSEAARQQHEEIGFHDGWEQTSRHLEALARTL